MIKNKKAEELSAESSLVLSLVFIRKTSCLLHTQPPVLKDRDGE